MEYSNTDIDSKSQTAQNNPILMCSVKQYTPNLRNLQSLITQETLLGIQNNIHPTIVNAYRQTIVELKIQLRKVELSRWGLTFDQNISILEDKIKRILYKLTKLKQINIYFQDFKKESGMLEADVQKFLFYHPKDNLNILQSKLYSFLTEPTTSELILKQYEKSFNPNNFAADIINFFKFLHENKLIKIPESQPYVWVRNKDLLLIENTNIIFRQVCQISDKYTLVSQQLENSYIHLDFISPQSQPQICSNKKYREETQAVDSKMKQLKVIAEKIKRHAGNFEGLSSNNQTIILPEEPELFEAMSKEFQFGLKDRNENFSAFLEELYEGKPAFEVNTDKNFNFIRLKIIKTEMRWHLNRLFSALNVASYINTKLHNNITPNPCHYSFQPPALLIKYELNSKRMSFYSERPAKAEQLQLLCKNMTVSQKQKGFVLQLECTKAVYPSALHNYYYLLKYLLCLSTILQQKNIYSEQLLLEITSIKADELMQWAQTGMNLLQMIKGKNHGCYSILQEYIQLAFSINWLQELEYVEKQIEKDGVCQLLSFYTAKEKKAEWINQIIFQLDSSYDIAQPLQILLEIQKKNKRIAYISDHHYFYELILNEIIQTRNNLKFDRCYSFSALHQLFGLPNARPSNLKQLSEKLAPISQSRMLIPDLLRFYTSQCKLKREVFKAELYWISIVQPQVKNKFIISNQKKKISFKDFLDENAKSLLNLGQKSLEYYLKNLEEIQRAVLLFGHQVQRLKLIQCSLLYLKPDFPLEDHLSAFNYKQLQGFFSHCSNFNFVDDIFVRRDKGNYLLSAIKKQLEHDKIKFCDLNVDLQIVTLKNLLASFVFFIYAFGHHYNSSDCMILKEKVIDKEQLPECHLKVQIWRSKRDIIKEYQQCQFLDWQSLSQLVQIYELLIQITFNRVLEREDIPLQDKIIMKKIRQEMPSYECFRSIQNLRDIEKTKHFANISSKSHTYTSLKCIFDDFRQKRQKYKNYCKTWNAIEYIFTLSEIGIVSRRIFCNELIELKFEISSEEWKSFNKKNCLDKLRQYYDKEFIQKINQFLVEELASIQLLNSSYNLNQNYCVLTQMCRKQIIQQYDNTFEVEVLQKKPIILFDQERGVEVDIKEQEQAPQITRHNHKNRRNNRGDLGKGITIQNPQTLQTASYISQKVNLQIVKESLPTRKMIYQLQLEQKRVRNEIAWQTCKLEHNVINKINQFIQESNQDQKQSLINFKYTVNLETIKGIENVIHERTELIGKRHLEEEEAFITQPKPERLQNNTQQESLLQVNVRNIFHHVKKIKVFWAWKNIYLKKQCGDDQWSKFSSNAEKILYNKQNMDKLSHVEQLRQSCSNKQILCYIIKEQNLHFNNYIKNAKINNLTQKLKKFKLKHGVYDERDTEQTQIKVNSVVG